MEVVFAEDAPIVFFFMPSTHTFFPRDMRPDCGHFLLFIGVTAYATITSRSITWDWMLVRKLE